LNMAYGMKFWYLHDKKYSFEEFVIKASWSDEDIIMWKLSAK